MAITYTKTKVSIPSIKLRNSSFSSSFPACLNFFILPLEDASLKVTLAIDHFHAHMHVQIKEPL